MVPTHNGSTSIGGRFGTRGGRVQERHLLACGCRSFLLLVLPPAATAVSVMRARQPSRARASSCSGAAREGRGRVRAALWEEAVHAVAMLGKAGRQELGNGAKFLRRVCAPGSGSEGATAGQGRACVA